MLIFLSILEEGNFKSSQELGISLKSCLEEYHLKKKKKKRTKDSNNSDRELLAFEVSEIKETFLD